jgi:putative heme-binding domain-containing protein
MALRNNLAASGMYASVASQIAGDADAQERLANVSLGVSSADAAEYLFSHLQRTASSGPKAEYAHHAARHLAAAKLPAFYDTIVAPLGAAESASSPSLSREAALLRAVSRGLRERAAASPPVVHEAALRLARKLLARNQEPRVREGLELAGEQRLKEVYSEVAAWTAREARFAGLRGAALDSCAAIDAAAAVPLLERLLLDGGEEFALRQKAAQLLAGINSEASCGALGRGLRIAAGPLAVEIAAGMAISRPGAEALVAEIESGKASPRLLEEPAVAGRWRGVQTPELESQRQKLLSGLQPRDARLKQLVDQRRQAYLAAAGQSQANVELGKAVFQKSCAACHKVGGVGNKIGPELDGIGHRGLDRLLEDVLDPNRNVDQAFRSTLLTTTDGRALAGLVLREEGQVLVLADAQGKEVRVAQSEIAERALSPLSPMPANAGEVISEVDFQHLVAFLLSQQAELRPM